MSHEVIYSVPYLPYDSSSAVNETLVNQGWTTAYPSHPHHGWAWAIVVLLVIIVIIFIVFRSFWQDNSQFGTYSEPIVGPCNGNNLCTDPGQRVVTRNCQPHPTTGKGCLIPNGPRQGQQSYESLVTIEDCSPLCVRSKWKEISPDETICQLDLPNQTSCVPAGTFGTKKRTFQCVANDDDGVNQCTHLGLAIITGPTDQIGTRPTLNTFEVGDQVDINVSCQYFNLPTCGQWLKITPTPDFDQPPQKININDPSVEPCLFDPNLMGVPNCIVSDDPSTSDIRWQNLREGYQLNPMSCVFQQNSDYFEVTPINSTNFCQPLIPPTCSDTSVSPQQIIEGTLPTQPPQNDPVALLCDESPVCMNPCRSFQTEITEFGQFNSIVGRIISLRCPNLGYLSLANAPSHLPNVNPFQDNKSDPTLPLFPVETTIIPFGQTKTNCSAAATEFNTTLLMMLGQRSIEQNRLKAQILAEIGGTYLGWLSLDNGILLWRQAYNIYQGPGISSYDPLATTFQIEVNGNLGPPPAGFPASTIGTIPISLFGPLGQAITVTSLNGSSCTLEMVSAIVYNAETLNTDSRINRNLLNCNLLYGNEF